MLYLFLSVFSLCFVDFFIVLYMLAELACVLFMLHHFNFLLPIEMIKDSVLFMLHHFNFLLHL